MNPWLWLPLLSALVGGGTNCLAVFLALHPLRPLRLGPLRWQGLLSRKAAVLARDFCTRIAGEVVGLRALMAPIEPARMAEEVERQLGARLDGLLEAMLSQVNPAHWQKLRPAVRAQWCRQLRPATARTTERILEALRAEPERYIDLPQLVERQVAADPGIVTEAFWSTGRREFRFIVWSGGLIGGLLGLPLALLWPLWPQPLVAAAGGALVGGLTNWLAIWLVFEPRQPVRLGPFRLLGLIHRRQHNTARLLAGLALDRLITFGALARHLGEQPAAFGALCQQALRQEMDRTAGGSAQLVTLALGGRDTEVAVAAMAAAMAAAAPSLMAEVQLPDSQRAGVLQVLLDGLARLPAETYGELLRSAIRDEEPLLVWSGVLCGAAAALAGALLL